ncbi:polysaccharide deacetylase family protein [Bailinhaonella thermotolerans]|uniref:Polysaccharide deacetylase family protein n=2 Tax=Bailinhaonella thermotolerans TaxID=1070861 RepID=A0A3A4BPC6_9ACTN|nr:polysaccharide deacetylase family protein [Bailinhaonella thermotolerans]
MYHAVTDDPSPEIAPLAVGPARFARQMELLRERGHHAVTVSRLVAALHGTGGALPPDPVVITFDDGFADVHEHALPVLDRLGLTATVYVTTGWVGDRGRRAPGTMLTWGQTRELAAAGIEIGGHSHSHPQLDQLADGDLRDELRRCRGLLEDGLDRPVASMAYPYGYSSRRVRREARRAGYWSACAVANRLVGDLDDVLALPRLTVGRATSNAAFARVVAGSGIPLIYLRERVLTKGYAVVRRTRYGVRRALGRV